MKVRRPSYRLSPFLIALCASLALVLASVPAASAAKRQTQSGQPLTMTSDTIQYNPNPSTPTSCLTEDDFATRTFSGALNGSDTTSYQLCGLNTDGVTAGGIGLETDVYVVGSLGDLIITAPDGTVHHAVLTGSSTSKGVTTYHYTACYVPPYYLSTDTGTNPLSGGTWNMTLSGQMTNAKWTINAQMADVVFQQTYCPVSEQNLL